MAADLALDGLVSQQHGKVALGAYQVEQVRAVIGFGLLVVLLYSVHLYPKLNVFDLLDGRALLVLGRLHIRALLRGCGLEQGVGMRYGDGFVGNHQLHRLSPAYSLHIAKDPGDV